MVGVFDSISNNIIMQCSTQEPKDGFKTDRENGLVAILKRKWGHTNESQNMLAKNPSPPDHHNCQFVQDTDSA